MTPEGRLTRRTKKKLDSVDGLWYYKVSDRFTSGIPDFIVCYKGRLGALELKAPKKKATELQKITLDRIFRAGGVVSVADCDEKVDEFINQLTEDK